MAAEKLLMVKIVGNCLSIYYWSSVHLKPPKMISQNPKGYPLIAAQSKEQFR